MDWPCGWATLYLLMNVSNIFCQNIPLERMLPEVSAQPQTTNSKMEAILTQRPSKAQIINALVSYVAAKGLLPKTSQKSQSTLPQEKPQIATRQNAPKLTFVNLQPQISSNCDKQPIISSIPAVSGNSIQNQMSPPAISCSQGLMVQPNIQTESVSWTLPSQTCQGGPLQPQMSFNCDKQPMISSIPAVSGNSIQNQMSPPVTSCSQGLIVQPKIQTESVSWTLPPQICQGGPLQPQISSNCDKQPIISSIPAVSGNFIQNQMSPPAISCSQGLMVQPNIQTESVTWTLPSQTCQGGPLQPQMSFNCDKQPMISSIPAVSGNSIQNQMSPPVTLCSQGLIMQPKIQTESVSWTLPPQICQGGPLQPQMSSNCDKKPIISSIPTISVNSIQNQMSPPATSCSQGLIVQPKIQTESVSWTLPSQTCQGGSLQSQMSSNCDQQPIITSIPAVSVESIQSQASPPATLCSQGLMVQPKIQTESISWTLPPQTCQGGCLENYACTQPSQTAWQIPQLPQPVTTLSPSNQPFDFNEAIPPFANWQISPPSRRFTPINTECSTVENVYDTNCGMLTEEPLLVTCDSKPGIPINLQINMPTPNDQCPSITIITNAPTNPEPAVAFSPYAFPPPPIMMKKSRSCLSKLLPIILLALIEDCGSCGGCGCPYNCDSDDIIPIPYPIPIPVNNHMINVCNSPCSSRN